MENINVESWQDKLNRALNEEGINDHQFFDFMKEKVKRLPLKVEEFGWGVFPIISEEGILVDIRMVVPAIYDIKSLCVNLHEFTHAYEVYFCLGKVYVWNVEESERKARDAEKKYLKSLNSDLL